MKKEKKMKKMKKEKKVEKIITVIKKEPVFITRRNKLISINKNRGNFINEIELLRIKNNIYEESYMYLKELIIKLSNEKGILLTPEKKILELEISNRKLLDWHKSRFDSKKDGLKEKTKNKIGIIFDNFDEYMWKGKLASFSELKYLSGILAKKI